MGFINTDRRTKLGRENALLIAILKFVSVPIKWLIKLAYRSLKWLIKIVYGVYKNLFVFSWRMVKWLSALSVVVLKFTFSLIKKLFIKAADRDGDGDVDFEDVKLVLKGFTAQGRLDKQVDKLEKEADALQKEAEALEKLEAATENLAKAEEDIASKQKKLDA